MRAGGGIKAINYSLKVAQKVGNKNFIEAITSKNTCKTCALGMGGQQGGMKNEAGHFPEICKKSMQANLTDIQPAIAKKVFSKNSIEDFKKMSGRQLEHLGRLNDPLYKSTGDTHYKPVSWDFVIGKIIEKLKVTDANKTFFYSSGRSSNEAGFLLQLFARVYGTNNVNNCSFYCHQASGEGLKTTIGSGTATIQLDDIEHTDLIFVIGANPASNHPRFVRELMLCRRRGGNVIVINPAKELGLVKFAVPSDVQSMLTGGSDIASEYIQPNISGDIALFKGIAKFIIESEQYDLNFIHNYTNNFSAYQEDIKNTSWNEIVNNSGISKEEIKKVADIYASAKNVVFSWAMGMTHHEHGVENVESIANLCLLRGMIGRKYAGLLPLRGHSNVQGIGSVGVTPMLKDKVFKNIEEFLKIKLPTSEGMDTMACMKAAMKDEIDFAFLLGGNLYGSNPDSKFAEKALDNIPFKVFLNTTLNYGHFFGVEQESIILPVAARDEEKQKTTQESMFNFIRLSDGGILRLDNVRSEVDIISDVAIGVLGNEPINFSEFKNHINIRKAIANVVPGFDELLNIDQSKKEFHLKGRVLHTPEFKTKDKKANFQVVKIPELKAKNKDEFCMMSIRSEGQFNTIVYEETDIYRGQDSRWIVLMNKKDIHKLGLEENEKVTLQSSVGEMKDIVVRQFDLPRGNIATYYPESNVLIPTTVDPRSKT
ncbi:MAG: FdhF/YdeP family oxidoreductase, partial [Candidatus Sericytochromatia bacterium]|nr:FdhF/YdeP family oxidoreductase [Candidatus Sericytochromatia bacterium]